MSKNIYIDLTSEQNQIDYSINDALNGYFYGGQDEYDIHYFSASLTNLVDSNLANADNICYIPRFS